MFIWLLFALGATQNDKLEALPLWFQGGHSIGSQGNGTVYSIDVLGNEKVLYSFAGPPDGSGPFGNPDLLNVNGTLYGTTHDGGTPHEGTVFTVTTSGQEAVLYDFKGHPDGAAPRSGLIDVKGTLYGTTFYGGAYTGECRSSVGCGTVFSIIPRR